MVRWSAFAADPAGRHRAVRERGRRPSLEENRPNGEARLSIGERPFNLETFKNQQIETAPETQAPL
jgi:hypothetical protein